MERRQQVIFDKDKNRSGFRSSQHGALCQTLRLSQQIYVYDGRRKSPQNQKAREKTIYEF